MDVFWFGLGVLQVGFGALVLAALLTWRGEHLWPAPGRPLGALPALLALALFAIATTLMVRVWDAEFSRYLGTGSLMLAALAVLAVTFARARRQEP